ncbi:hypothetical protein N7G274_002733 [Stereocaulon virgatum]|uniref:Pyridoxal-dependent decarboxylase n=1 Tax=Stereocaulon virgatum TaxID=373712 RepID=A0ABR4AIN9_9LECA
MNMDNVNDNACLERIYALSADALSKRQMPVLPDVSALAFCRACLFESIPDHGIGVEETTNHLCLDVAPVLNASGLSPNYYGFVTGGITPAARVAESLVSLYDQTPQVHLPNETIASNVEDRALSLLLDLLNFDRRKWSGVFTTGATASNVVGLACGREFIINQRLKACMGPESQGSLGSLGLLKACRMAQIDEINIYTTMAHSSLYKASSIVGLGRSCVHDVRRSGSGFGFDLEDLERRMESGQHNSVSIVVVSCGEVNTGLFATYGRRDLLNLRSLCDKYGAWLHVDGAFGIFAKLLDSVAGFERVAQGAEGVDLADSITGDAHKLLNVPYDCGFFFCRHPDLAQQVFQNPNAAYLDTKTAPTDTIRSPLNIGIENSRRFRGLPVYATLVAYGRDGYRDMLHRQSRFARAVAAYLYEHDAFELLPKNVFKYRERIDQNIFIIVLFKAKDDGLNEQLVQRINASSKIYVSGTVWDGSPASRIAVANWQVEPHRDLEIVKGVVEEVIKTWAKGK